METFAIMVLNDGSTYSGVEGCKILILNKEAFQFLENGDLEIRDLVHDSRRYIVHTIEMGN
jgi:hypothetical protein